LVACAGEAQWSKDGRSPEQAAADLASCRNTAQTAMRRDADIDTDIMASRRQDWQLTGVLDAKRATLSNASRQQSTDLVSRCMMSLGYAPGA
jgi:hypothetical protein